MCIHRHRLNDRISGPNDRLFSGLIIILGHELSALRADFFQRIDLIINKMEIPILSSSKRLVNRKFSLSILYVLF